MTGVGVGPLVVVIRRRFVGMGVSHPPATKGILGLGFLADAIHLLLSGVESFLDLRVGKYVLGQFRNVEDFESESRFLSRNQFLHFVPDSSYNAVPMGDTFW